MSVRVDIDLRTGPLGQMLHALRHLPEEATKASMKGIAVASKRLIGKAAKERFTGDGPFAPALRRMGRGPSGDMKRKLYAKPPEITGKGEITVRMGSGVKYWAIHEFGGKTKPHTIRPVNGAALKFVVGGKTIFAKSVRHPGSQMPARAPLQAAVEDHAEKLYTAEIMRALDKALDGKGGLA
jgi:phage gpG-like protein